MVWLIFIPGAKQFADDRFGAALGLFFLTVVLYGSFWPFGLLLHLFLIEASARRFGAVPAEPRPTPPKRLRLE